MEIRTLKKTAARARPERIEESAAAGKANGRSATSPSDVLEDDANDCACLTL